MLPGEKCQYTPKGAYFLIDVRILRATANKYGLDEVMKRLYFNHALKNTGVSEQDYQSTIEAVSGESFEEFFDKYVNNCQPFESILTDAFDYLGLEMKHEPSSSYSAAKLGFMSSKTTDGNKITRMYPGGPAELGGLSIDDVIIAVNGFVTNGELDSWLEHFIDDAKRVTINRNGRLLDITLPEVDRNFYMTYSVQKIENPNGSQQRAFEAWVS